MHTGGFFFREVAGQAHTEAPVEEQSPVPSGTQDKHICRIRKSLFFRFSTRHKRHTMLHTSIKTLSMVGAALALAATGALAQTPANSTVNSTQTPATVGVTPQAANEANQKAVQRSDTATLVRTEPTAAEQARDAANRAQNNATPSTMGTTTDGMAPRRAARADRN